MSFFLTILGAGGAVPAHGRFPSAQYLEIHNRHFLIDCGEGTQFQLMRYQIRFHQIERIFISHLHGDHYLGLMGLLSTMHLQNRTKDLHLYSQPGLDEMLCLHFKHSKTVLRYKLHFHYLSAENPSVLFEDEVMTVEGIPLKHKLPTTGFLFKEKERHRKIDKTKLPPGILLQHIIALKQGQDVKDENGNLLYKNKDYTIPGRAPVSYAYCTDTAYQENLAEQVKSVDLLYHEATFMNLHEDKAEETLHSTAAQAAQLASKAQVKQLLLGHFSSRYKLLDGLLNESREKFPNVRLAQEGEIIDLYTL